VDVIVVISTPAIQAARRATRTIPIVMATSSDPVQTGLVASLARPGGNVTGLSILSSELSGKRLQLVREAAPGVSRVAVLWNPSNPGSELQFRQMQLAARAVGAEVVGLEATHGPDLDRALAAALSARAGALVVLDDPLPFNHRARITAFAAKHRLPALYGLSAFASDGGLLTYGPDTGEMMRRAATYVDKIVKGARPGDLPIEQPTKFELVVNLKTAKAMGLTIPASVLLRADRVIE
jgi:putative ABC transport system substrate-binding protein